MVLLACPQCRATGLQGDADTGWRCTACSAVWPSVDGVGRFLPAARAAHYESFLRDYTAVRLFYVNSG